MMNQVVTLEKPPPRSVLINMATRFGMEPAAFEQTIRATCLPPGKANLATKEQFAAFLLVAKEYNLNPLTKEIYAFPTKQGGIIPIVGVDGWSNLINSNPQFDGMDFVDELKDGKLISITCRMYRKDRAHPIEATEYMGECDRSSEDKYNAWNKWPRRMLRHKAMIQAARYAFGFAGIYDPDEGERIAEVKPVREIVNVNEIPSAAATQEINQEPDLATADEESIDPEKILGQIETDMASCSEPEALEQMWNGWSDKVMKLTPPDQKAAWEMLEKNSKRITPETAVA